MLKDEVEGDVSDLSRLIYYSQNRIPGAFADVAAEVDTILSASRKNNPALCVTGALIFNTGVFAQVLEGPRRGIEITFERIQCDPRHGDVNVLAFEDIAQRNFPSWSMAFLGRSREARDLFSHIGAATGFDAKRLEGERIFAIMQEIALEEEATGKVR